MTADDKRTYGEVTKKRVKVLVEALLAYANEDLAGELHASLLERVKLEHEDGSTLVVRASRAALKELAAVYEEKYSSKTTNENVHKGLDITDVFFHLRETLGILEDHRPPKSNKTPHFTLKLWYSYKDQRKNLAEFELKWSQSTKKSLARRRARTPQKIKQSVNQDAKILCFEQIQEHNYATTCASKPLGIYYKTKLCNFNVFRFIPFYLGQKNQKALKSYLGFETLSIDELKIACFNDGFVVAILENRLEFKDVIDFLCQRRLCHLSILQKNSWLTQVLLENQEAVSTNPLIFNMPKSLLYVMSIHHIPNSDQQVTTENIRLMTEPSVLGITDDPKDDFELEGVVSDSFVFQDINKDLEEDIYTVKARNSAFHISWANVIVETCDAGNPDVENLVATEVLLQKLWYKLFLYADNLNTLDNYMDLINAEIFKEMKKEIFKTKMDYTSFLRPDATGATHLNSLKEKLVQTSRISQIYQDFVYKCSCLDELEKVL